MRGINTLLPNIYREMAKRDCTMRIEFFRTKQKNVLSGPLRYLVEMFLARLPFRIETEIDAERMCALFEAQKPGLIKCERSIRVWVNWLWVKKKPFEKWVRQNATRICKTVKKTRMEEELNRRDRMFLSRR